MQIAHYIDMVHKSEQDMATALRKVAKEHGTEPDVLAICQLMASWSDEMVQDLHPFIKKYGEKRDTEPDRLMTTLFKKPRKGPLGLLRDLQDLYLMASEAEVSCVILRQAASGLHDKELIEVCNKIEKQSKRQSSWFLTRMKSAAPQTLIVA